MASNAQGFTKPESRDAAKRKNRRHAFPLWRRGEWFVKRRWAGQHRSITMIIQLTCVYIVMVSGILSAGCAFANYAPQERTQTDSAPGTSLAGSYKDIGSDGSIEPHPNPSYRMSQKPQSPTGGITLGGEVDMPDVRTGTIKKAPPSRTDPASDPEGKGK